MDCTGFRKYVGAFADGELEVNENLDALEHLNMCRHCAARVGEIHALRDALARGFDEVRAPQHLRDQLLTSLDADLKERVTGGRGWERLAGVPAVLSRWTVPLGMAAALVLIVGLWSYWPFGEPQAGTITVIAGRVAADVRAQHEWCVTNRGLGHHDESLTRDPAVMASRLSREFKLEVIVPDLSAHGFGLIGADRCGVQGRPGAHVLYHSPPSAATLSVFTVARVAALGSSAVEGTPRREYFASEGRPTSVVAWNDGPQTYLMCGELTGQRMLQLAGGVRTASAAPPFPRPSSEPMFASLLAD